MVSQFDFQRKPSERWVSKRELASHYGFTVRWVEYRLAEGMPSRLIGSRRRFRISEVDQWLHRRAGGELHGKAS